MGVTLVCGRLVDSRVYPGFFRFFSVRGPYPCEEKRTGTCSLEIRETVNLRSEIWSLRDQRVVLGPRTGNRSLILNVVVEGSLEPASMQWS